MKKLVATLMMLAMLVIALPFASNAQTTRRNNHRNNRTYATRNYEQRNYEQPSLYRRHRNVINVGAATAGGAVLGALFGGKKGAAIGALAGAGAGALYTYKIKPKQRRY